MGQEIPTSKFTRKDFDRFAHKLHEETRLLARYFEEDRFSNLHNVGGFEIEAWLVDDRALPNPCNEEFLRLLDSPLVVMELARFNVELNVRPQVLKDDALSVFHRDLTGTWSDCRDTAHKLNADLMTVGIHPGVSNNQLNLDNMSSSSRYTALNEQVLAKRKGKPLVLDIQGRDHLSTQHFDVMMESATTSFQIHLQVRPNKAVRVFNAATIASAPLLAISANSPYLFGHDLWDETRIPLFEQSVDDGTDVCKRVTFGRHYLEDSLYDCFTENLEVFPPLLPIDMQTPAEEFSHLRLHNGTVWRWNRPLIGFGEDKGIHLRIENRVVPSGPTLADMIANAAFFWGLVRTLADQDEAPESQLPFEVARENFYGAARNSLGSRLQWLDGKHHAADKLVTGQLIELAREGLLKLGMDADDCADRFRIIRERVESGQNGASWQRRWVEKHGHDMEKLSMAYLEQQKTGKPVHEWPI